MDNSLWARFGKRNTLLTAAFVVTAGFVLLSAGEAKAATPFGHVDGVSDAGVVSGWAIDPDIAGAHIEVHAHFDGPAGKSKVVVGSSTTYDRCDVHFYTDFNDCGFDYGFDIQIPASMNDGKEHKVYVYALDARVAQTGESGWPKTGASTLLGGSPKTFRLGVSANTPRHARGALVSHNGTIYFIGDQFRYPFPSADVFLSWGVTFSQVVPANSGDIAMPIGATVEYKPQSPQSNRLPKGNVDGITTNGRLRGWVFDPDASSSDIEFRMTIDGQWGNSPYTPYGGQTVYARSDVNSAFSISGTHGFEVDMYSIPGINQNATHEVWVYAIDKNDGSLFLVNGSPYSFFMLSIPAPEDSVVNRDAQRLNKVRQVMTALELYYNDMGKYPGGGLEIHPYGLDMTGWTSTPNSNGYLSVVGHAPAADGTCSTLDNEYYYTNPEPGDYYLIFCLGGDYGGYSKGVHFASPSGIQ
jgi:hypothetical protein